ncbi:hypothetical protein [Metapseudomonas otitidis]|uniref:hypothetical protein n=1 Tax=Metapseudomonas otitidis TaxID=319939 RepID=UPI001AAF5503|nr:hypothetical protein [Pseudomonas otitidis]MBO2926639.1 hypothetical protein [Pseudomonas otitidis]
MSMYYSPSRNGFYSEAVHGQSMPADCVEISEELYVQLLNGQAAGKIIKAGEGGVPYLQDPPGPDYQQELSALNAAYQADVDKFNRSFAIAYLSDGPSQESKQAAIRAQYEVRKTQHANDVIDLKIKYGV